MFNQLIVYIVKVNFILQWVAFFLLVRFVQRHKMSLPQYFFARR